MLAGPKRGHLRPQMSRPRRTGPSRTVGAAYTVASGFRQRFAAPQPGFSKRAQLGRIYLFSRGF